MKSQLESFYKDADIKRDDSYNNSNTLNIFFIKNENKKYQYTCSNHLDNSYAKNNNRFSYNRINEIGNTIYLNLNQPYAAAIQAG